MTMQNTPTSSTLSAATSQDIVTEPPSTPAILNATHDAPVEAAPPGDVDLSSTPRDSATAGTRKTPSSDVSSVTLEQFDDDEGLVDGRPLETLSLPRAEARRKLAEQVQTRFNLPEGEARAIARAVKDPTEARRRLDFLIRRRFRGGWALCLETEVWSPAVIPSLANPRAKGRHPYPAALAASKPLDEEALRPVSLRAMSQDGSPVLEVLADSQRHVRRTLKANETRVLERNDLRREIEFDGVREHVLAFPTVVRHADGTPAVATLMTADGSSRTTAAHDLTATDTFEAVYEYPGDERAWRTHMAPIVAIQSRSITTVTDEDWARHRVAVMPAFIVLKIESAGAQPVTALDAYRALTGAIHVHPPKEWMPTATLDEQADAVLGALTAAGRITEEHRMYLEGGYTPDEAEARGYPRDLGARAAHVVATIMNPAHRAVVHAAIRALIAKRNVQPKYRAEVVAGLILRPISHLFKTDRDLDGARSILERTLVMPAFSQLDWNPPRETVPPQSLLDRASDELGNGSPIGPDRVALGTEALMWLVVSEVPAAAGGSSGERVFRRDRPGEDNRAGSSVMSSLLESSRGLTQLFRAVEAGRDGKPVPYVREDLEIDRDARRQPIPLDNVKLREIAREAAEVETVRNTGSQINTPESPQEKVHKYTNRLEACVDDVAAALRAIEEVKTATGDSFVKQHGIPKGFVSQAMQQLTRISQRLYMHGERYEEGRVPGPAHDETARTSAEGTNP